MNEFFGYCGWDFGGALNSKFQRGEHVRIGRTIYRVIFRIGSWHWLKRMGGAIPYFFELVALGHGDQNFGLIRVCKFFSAQVRFKYPN